MCLCSLSLIVYMLNTFMLIFSANYSKTLIAQMETRSWEWAVSPIITSCTSRIGSTYGRGPCGRCLLFGTITPQNKPICLQRWRFEIDSHPAHIEIGAELSRIREVRRDDEPWRLRVQQYQITVSDIGWRQVRNLSDRPRTGNTSRGEGEVLLKPEELGRDS